VSESVSGDETETIMCGSRAALGLRRNIAGACTVEQAMSNPANQKTLTLP
jgi:hypothetical protein